MVLLHRRDLVCQDFLSLQLFLDCLLHLAVRLNLLLLVFLVVRLHWRDLVCQDSLSLQLFLDCQLHLVVLLNL